MDAVLRKRREQKLTKGDQMEEKRTKGRTTENECKSGYISRKKATLKGKREKFKGASKQKKTTL